MKTSSKTNWDYLKTLPDDKIDLCDAPQLTPEMRAKAWIVVPNTQPVTVQLEIDLVLLAWFQAQGEGYEQRMLAAPRLYALAHKTAK